MKSNIESIVEQVLNCEFTNQELTRLVQAIKLSKEILGNAVLRKLSIGDNVNFTSSRTGKNVTGHVTKIAVKYVTVNTIEGLWKVPGNMLTKID